MCIWCEFVSWVNRKVFDRKQWTTFCLSERCWSTGVTCVSTLDPQTILDDFLEYPDEFSQIFRRVN